MRVRLYGIDAPEFQHTAARRRPGSVFCLAKTYRSVSTHSRPKAAGATVHGSRVRQCFNTQPPEGGRLAKVMQAGFAVAVSTHSRPKAAGPRVPRELSLLVVSTHSRPKAAGAAATPTRHCMRTFQHTAARRRPGNCWPIRVPQGAFQHTAARRRPAICKLLSILTAAVSTHSRPKAAGDGKCCFGD